MGLTPLSLEPAMTISSSKPSSTFLVRNNTFQVGMMPMRSTTLREVLMAVKGKTDSSYTSQNAGSILGEDILTRPTGE